MAWELRSTAAALIGLLLAGWAAPSQAVPITYSLTLTPAAALGLPGTGTGSFTIEGLDGTGVEIFTPSNSSGNNLISLTFNIDSQNFNLASAIGPGPTIIFIDGGLRDVIYSGKIGILPINLISGSLTYTYLNLASYRLASGSVGAAAVPEPGSLALIGTGLLGVGLVVRRRRANAAA